MGKGQGLGHMPPIQSLGHQPCMRRRQGKDGRAAWTVSQGPSSRTGAAAVRVGSPPRQV